jgi:phage terminase small subunit
MVSLLLIAVLVKSGLKKNRKDIRMKEEESKNGNGSREGLKEPEALKTPPIEKDWSQGVTADVQSPFSSRDSKEEEEEEVVVVKNEVKEEEPKQVKKLTEKEKMFCKEYLVDFNGSQAAIRAGYSVNSSKQIGYENLTKPYLREELQHLIDKRAEKCALDAQYVLENLKEVVQRCMDKEPILDSKGLPSGEWKFNAMGANKALELIGKHLGLFKDVQEVKSEQGFQLVILGDQPKKDDDK